MDKICVNATEVASILERAKTQRIRERVQLDRDLGVKEALIRKDVEKMHLRTERVIAGQILEVTEEVKQEAEKYTLEKFDIVGSKDVDQS